MVNQSKLVKMVLTAMFIAIIVAMTFIPYVGYITYGGLSITTLHVVVILGAVVLGPARGTLLGLVWGITCIIYAAMNGTADSFIFLDPRISVIPRIIVGLAAGWAFRGLNILLNRLLPGNKRATVYAATTTAVVGTLTNTVLVLSAISLFGTGLIKLGNLPTVIIQTAIALNGALELVMAVVLVPVISIPLFSYLRKKGDF